MIGINGGFMSRGEIIYIGIDPGLDGAVAVKGDGFVDIYDTPTFTVKHGKKNKRHCDAVGMAEILKSYPAEDCHIALEKVHSMKGQGVASMFSMGEGFGIWKGIIAMGGFKLTLVTPQAWKKVMMSGMGKEKDASRQRAIELFPTLYDQLKRKKDHDRAEALLIAEFLSRQYS